MGDFAVAQVQAVEVSSEQIEQIISAIVGVATVNMFLLVIQLIALGVLIVVLLAVTAQRI